MEFALTSAGSGAEITPATARTGADGRAQAYVLLGDKVGPADRRGESDGHRLSPATPSRRWRYRERGGQSAQRGVHLALRPPHLPFTDASTDADGTVTGRLWSFGDGSTSTERNPSHDYGESGTYSVTLTVTDDDGSERHRVESGDCDGPAAVECLTPRRVRGELPAS